MKLAVIELKVLATVFFFAFKNQVVKDCICFGSGLFESKFLVAARTVIASLYVLSQAVLAEVLVTILISDWSVGQLFTK